MVITKDLNHLGLSASNRVQILEFFIQRLELKELRQTWGHPNQVYFVWYLT